MEGHMITAEQLQGFEKYLQREERSKGTIEKYLRDVGTFARWLDCKEVTKEQTVEWKEYLYQSGRAIATINSMLASLHSFFSFAGWKECRVRYYKMQRKMFRETKRELNKKEYYELLTAASQKNNQRLALLLETICATGVRVSEIRYLTVEAIRCGRAQIALKGKVRTILIPRKLAKKLLKYAGKQKIACGELFVTASGKSLSRGQIWREMKSLCKNADVSETKVFPHNLRHLFAITYYHVSKDICALANVLGHSSIETTRIYLVTTGVEEEQQLGRLGLVR